MSDCGAEFAFTPKGPLTTLHIPTNKLKGTRKTQKNRIFTAMFDMHGRDYLPAQPLTLQSFKKGYAKMEALLKKKKFVFRYKDKTPAEFAAYGRKTFKAFPKKFSESWFTGQVKFLEGQLSPCG